MNVTRIQFEPLVQSALLEDIGTGDVTTLSTVSPDATATARMLVKSPGVLCGLAIAETAFHLVDPAISFRTGSSDGERHRGQREVIAEIEGPARGILTAERVALNFLQRLSGVATVTAQFADAIAGTRARIVDTRKTTPGLRVLEKYAVRTGGGHNHRFGLADGVLIKDNHIAAAGGVSAAIQRARDHAPHTLRIEIEAKRLSQVEEALAAGADVILLDNMSFDDLKTGVSMVGGRALTEASGGVSIQTVRAIAETGVDLISIGALTHSAPALDISLDIEV